MNRKLAGDRAFIVVIHGEGTGARTGCPGPTSIERAATQAQVAVTITTGVASEGGVHLSAAYTYQFTTRDATDTSPIYVKNVTPAPDALCASATTPITITFSEGVDVSTLNSTNLVISGPGGTAIPAQISYDVATAMATLTPNSPLPSGSITVTVKQCGRRRRNQDDLAARGGAVQASRGAPRGFQRLPRFLGFNQSSSETMTKIERMDRPARVAGGARETEQGKLRTLY